MTAELVESVPAQMMPSVVDVSEKYSTSAHLCCCGCVQEVFTPLPPARWRVTVDQRGRVSFFPSIGNWSLACQSHYMIERAEVRWARTFSDDEIAWNRETERACRRVRTVAHLDVLVLRTPRSQNPCCLSKNVQIGAENRVTNE